MPPLETMDRNQTAVLWERRSGRAGVTKFGAPVVSGPVEIRVRWNVTRRQSVDAQGNKVQLVADVVTNRPVPLGSVMWLGSFEDWPTTGTGTDDFPGEDLHEVTTDDTTVDLKGRHTRYEFGLARYTNEVPTTQ